MYAYGEILKDKSFAIPLKNGIYLITFSYPYNSSFGLYVVTAFANAVNIGVITPANSIEIVHYTVNNGVNISNNSENSIWYRVVNLFK